ncbi:hypothetical protein LMH73_010285 [Vibrio splendidus]|nr:hypothetical protein [Vibrio splendidus]MCC4882741.1 hypothetical protein [Vibrio splendidus]
MTLNEKQELMAEEISMTTVLDTYEIIAFYADQNIKVSVKVSEVEELDEDDEEYEQATYHELPVRDAVVLCINGEEHEHGFTILAVDKYSREDFLA